MRTYLKNWMVQRSTSNLYQLSVTSDWNLVGLKVEFVSCENIFDLNKKVIETIVKYNIGSGSPNQLIMKTLADIPEKWVDLNENHLVRIRASDSTGMTDDESVFTSKTPIS